MKTYLKATLLTCSALWSFVGALSAQIVTFEFGLDADQAQAGQQLDPPIESSGTGEGFVQLNTDTNELSWNITFENLTTGLSNSHFHGPAAPDETAGVLVGIPMGDADGQTSGTLTGSDMITDTIEQHFLDHMTYVNLHTSNYPGGEVRGQVVPEPSTYALFAGMFALVGVWFWRRRGRK